MVKGEFYQDAEISLETSTEPVKAVQEPTPAQDLRTMSRSLFGRLFNITFLTFSLLHVSTRIHCITSFLLLSAMRTCPQGSARSGWKLFRRPHTSPPALPRSAPTVSPTTALQTGEACWISAVTKAECWCPWRGVKSDSAKQNRYCHRRRDFLSAG